MPCVQKMVFLGSLPSTRGSLPSTRNEWKSEIVVWKWNSCGWKWIWHHPSPPTCKKHPKVEFWQQVWWTLLRIQQYKLQYKAMCLQNGSLRHFHPQGFYVHPQKTEAKARLMFGSETRVDRTEFGIIHHLPTCKKHWKVEFGQSSWWKLLRIQQYNAMCSKNGIFGVTSIHKGVTSIHKKRVKKRDCCMEVKFLWMEVNLASSITPHLQKTPESRVLAAVLMKTI